VRIVICFAFTMPKGANSEFKRKKCERKKKVIS